jgi:hypothetical protein
MRAWKIGGYSDATGKGPSARTSLHALFSLSAGTVVVNGQETAATSDRRFGIFYTLSGLWRGYLIILE